MGFDYDAIVVGCGGIGSAAVYWLSRELGSRVLGLEQFELGHDHGGSQDHSRIIRLNYHDVKYTKLTPHTYDAFAEVERESGLQLVYKCGCLDFGVRGTTSENLIEMYAKSMAAQNIKFERWTPADLRRRFPQFNPDPDTLTLYQKDGGLVDAALANSVHIQLARARGATVLDNTPVTRIETEADGTAKVYTSKGAFTCRKVIVTAGAWINHVLGSVGVNVPIRVTQEQVSYYATPNVKDFTKENFPAWIFHAYKNNLDYYGLPSHVNSYSKIGLDAAGPVVSSETRSYTPDKIREAQTDEFFKHFIPKALGPKAYTKTCLYTMPPDRDFIIDTLEKYNKPQILVCNGAGHAYKFCSLLGRILAEKATTGRTQYDISGFMLDRPAINNPDTSGGVRIMGGNPFNSNL